MKKKSVLIRVLCVFLLCALCVTTLLDYSQQLQNSLTNETYELLANVSVDYNKSFSDGIACHIKALKVLAGSLVEMHGMTERDMVRVLQNAADNGGFSEMVICDMQGESCSNTGEIKDLSDSKAFKRALKDEADISNPLVDMVDGEKHMIITIPIRKEQEMEGVLFALYPLSTAEQSLLNFTYYSDGYGLVTSPDGTIILSSEHADRLADEDNLLTFLAKTKMIDYSVEELALALQNRESKSFAYTYEGQKRYVSFMPSTVNDWSTFSISSDTLMQQEKWESSIVFYRMIFRIALAAALVIVLIELKNRRYNNDVKQASEKYQSLLSHINGGMIIAEHALTCEQTIVRYVSQRFTDMTGYTLEDFHTLYHGKYLEAICEEDRKAVFDIYLEQIQKGDTYNMPYRIRKKDGSLLWVMDNGYLVKNADGLRNHSIITDITIVKQQEEKLRRSEKRFSIAINASSGTLFEVDMTKQLYTHFENAERIFGIGPEKLLEDTRAFSTLPYDEFVNAVTEYFFHPDDWELTKAAMKQLRKNGTVSYEARLRRADQTYLWARMDLSLNTDDFGSQSYLIGFMSDIDAIKKQTERLENKVLTDPMTGLYNKIAMVNLVNKTIQCFPNEHNALIVLDVDNFKGINDTLGHAFGDLILMDICAKLKAAFRVADIVGRMGGDEFAIFMRNVPDTSGVLKKMTELSASLRQTYEGEKGAYNISCSIGVIMLENHKEPFEAFYRKADAALYQAKQNGKDQFVLYQEKDAECYTINALRTNDEEMQSLKTAQSIETQIFELLYTSKDFNASINMALAAIGRQYHVSRVDVFENSNDNAVTSNIYEWCNEGITAEMERLQNISLGQGSESILNCFDQKGLLYCSDVRELPPYLRGVLEAKGALSTLKVMIMNEGKACGFIGFDDCTEHRAWTAEEIEKLSFVSKVLSVFLFKEKTEVALLENLQTRLKILDVLPDYICVVNPDNHSIEYTNRKMQELLPAAQQGAQCFVTLLGGQEEPCEDCMVERIKRGDTDNLEIVSRDKKLHLKVNAIFINWTKNQRMVLLYGVVKGN
ncbi:MAG: diguanylate cyclase [Clostridia bacterium]